jgi:hypothetical protein
MENLEKPPGLTPDDPHAPRRYPRDPLADDDRRYFCNEPYCKGHIIEDDVCNV